MLVISFIIWYLIKLGYNYTAEVQLPVDIDGNQFRVECIAEGSGYRIIAHRYFRRGDVRIPFRDIQATPSVINTGNFVVNPHSLQNAISARIGDLRIVSVGEIPEIRIPYTEKY